MDRDAAVSPIGSQMSSSERTRSKLRASDFAAQCDSDRDRNQLLQRLRVSEERGARLEREKLLLHQRADELAGEVEQLRSQLDRIALAPSAGLAIGPETEPRIDGELQQAGELHPSRSSQQGGLLFSLSHDSFSGLIHYAEKDRPARLRRQFVWNTLLLGITLSALGAAVVFGWQALQRLALHDPPAAASSTAKQEAPAAMRKPAPAKKGRADRAP
jgi:hypothetical protein